MLFLALLLNFVSLAAPAHSTITPTPLASSSLVGTVLGADGKPLAGATVLVADRRTEHAWPLESEFARKSSEHPVQEKITDLDGRFRITNLLGGAARMVVRSSDHATLRNERVMLAARSTTDLGDVQLALSGTVRGSVVDSGALAISNAKIYSFPRRAESVGFGTDTAAFELETDGLGQFELKSLPLGEWTLLIAAEGHAVQRFEGSLLPNDSSSKARVLRLQSEAEIGGQVHSLPSVRDLSHLVVRAVPASELDPKGVHAKLAQGYVEAEVEVGGAFWFESLLPDTTYIVRAGLRTQEFGVHDAWAPTAIIRSGNQNGRLEWLPSARVSFRALDVATAELAEGYELRLEGASPNEPKLPKGPVKRHLVKEVRPTHPDATIVIAAGGNGYRKFKSQAIKLEPGILSKAQDVTLWKHPVLEIQVTDALTRRPIYRANVVLREDQYKPPPRKSFFGLTEQNGKLSINDSPGIPRRVGISARGYAPQAFTSPFELVEGVLLVELEQGFDLTAKVSNSDGDALAAEGVVVGFGETRDRFLFSGTDTEGHTAYTDADGVAWFQHLGTAEYEFLLASWDVYADLVMPQNVRLEKGPVRELSFGIDTRTRIEGRVLEAGLPVAGAEVHCDGLRVRTDLEGAFVLDPVNPKTRAVTVSHPSRAADHTELIGLNFTKNEIDLRLPETLIEGIVLDTKGEPVDGAAIYLSDDRWQRSGSLGRAYDESLFRMQRDSRAEPVAVSDHRGWFTIRGVGEALGATLSARTSDGFVGLLRVRGIRAGGQITGVELVVRAPAVLNIRPLEEKLTGAGRIALVATFNGEAQGGTWMRVLAPYTGQSWKLTDLPGGKWHLTLVSLSDFGAIQDFDEMKRVRINSNETFDLTLD